MAPRSVVLFRQQLLRVCVSLALIGCAVYASAPPSRAEGAAKKSVFDTIIARTRPSIDKDAAARDVAPAALPETDLQAEGPGGDPKGLSANRGPAVVRGASVKGLEDITEFRLSLSAGVRAEIFTLANPYRVIIDLPDVIFELSAGAGSLGGGLISAFRYGLFAERKGRIVLDATGPVSILNAKMTSTGTSRNVELVLEFAEISAAAFGAGTGAGAPPPPSTKPAIYDDAGKLASSKSKPLVLIDPGHGGIDPGALGDNNILEKTVVLGVARKFRRRLEATGRYRVAITRTSDVFVSLDQRVKMSREMGADLFISLHADAIASKTFAPVVRGATVYTLSERASDEQARQMAEKENASDLVAGIDNSALEDANNEVRNILIDLIKRETSNFSTHFSNLLVDKLKSKISMSRDPQRSAAFKVLKQAHAPSVLVELGFMSNAADAKLMRQTEWQGKVAQSLVAAVDAFFDNRTARSAP